MMQITGKNEMPLHVLLVDDNPGDIRLTREAFHDSAISTCFHVAVDGLETMAFLRREGMHILAPRPDVILLDLNLPKMDGREVLTQIKRDGDLKSIPTIVLTSSIAEADIVASYQLQANCYLAKPFQLDAFLMVVKGIADFWFKKVLLPRNASPPGQPGDANNSRPGWREFT
jgi:chemotaxis family two-component system response regulator Rcp1